MGNLRHLCGHLKEALQRFLSLFDKLLASKRLSLLMTASAISSVIAIRSMHAYVTGYLLPDEAAYYVEFIIMGNRPQYWREAFVSLYAIFFQGVKDISSYILRATLWSLVWGVGSILVLYLALRALGPGGKATSMVLLSVPFMPMFMVLAPTVSSEGPGLFFALTGTLGGVLYAKTLKPRYALLAALGYALAYKSREPYLIFALGNLLPFLLMFRRVCWRRALKGFVSYAALTSLFLPIPVKMSLEELSFAQPVYSYASRLIAQVIRLSKIVAQTITRPEVQNVTRPEVQSGRP